MPKKKPAPLSPQPPPTTARLTFLCVAVILVAGVLAYRNTLSVPFLFDDSDAIVDNPTIRRLWPLLPALSPPPGGATVGNRPLLNLSFAINYALGGLNVRGYHALNLGIHLGAALVLFGIVRRTLLQPALAPRFGASARSMALVAALAWLLHPLQTEAVTYTVQRAESLMGLCFLLTLYAAIRAMHAARPLRWQLVSVASCLAGVGCKEVIVIAPMLVLWYDRTFCAGSFRAAWQRRRWFYLALVATWLPLGCLVASGGSRGGTAGFDIGVAPLSYWLTQFKAVVFYLKLSLWPHPLVFEYGTFFFRLRDALPYALVVIPLVAATLVALWRWPVPGFLGAWFFSILAPTSLVPGRIQMIVEHRLYLSLAAVVALAVVGLQRLAPRRFLPLGLAIAGALGLLTAARNHDYRSELSIWEDSVAKCPGSARAQNCLAWQLAKVPARTPEALEHLEMALRLDPNLEEAHNNYAVLLAKLPGRFPEALAHYQRALQINPAYALAHNNLANDLSKIPGHLDEALAHYQLALQIRPDYAEAHNNLAVLLAQLPGRLPEALAHFERALQLDPGYAQAHINLANELAKLPGRLPEAQAHYERALELVPDDSESHNNLAVICARQGLIAEAIRHLQIAVRLNPDNQVARHNLARLTGQRGN